VALTAQTVPADAGAPSAAAVLGFYGDGLQDSTLAIMSLILREELGEYRSMGAFALPADDETGRAAVPALSIPLGRDEVV